MEKTNDSGKGFSAPSVVIKLPHRPKPLVLRDPQNQFVVFHGVRTVNKEKGSFVYDYALYHKGDDGKPTKRRRRRRTPSGPPETSRAILYRDDEVQPDFEDDDGLYNASMVRRLNDTESQRVNRLLDRARQDLNRYPNSTDLKKRVIYYEEAAGLFIDWYREHAFAAPGEEGYSVDRAHPATEEMPNQSPLADTEEKGQRGAPRLSESQALQVFDALQTFTAETTRRNWPFKGSKDDADSLCNYVRKDIKDKDLTQDGTRDRILRSIEYTGTELGIAFPSGPWTNTPIYFKNREMIQSARAALQEKVTLNLSPTILRQKK